MRCLGKIEGRKPAESFVAYLLTQEISTHIESLDETQDIWEVWVRDEDKLARARGELSEFLANPKADRYTSALTKAREILQQKEKKRQKAARNMRRVDMTGRPSMMGGGSIPPLTLTLMILSIAISLLSNFSRPAPSNEWGRSIVEQLSFVSPIHFAESDGDPAASLKRGQLWRTITPIFLHGGMLHLAMNMFVLISFGRMVERWIGTPRYALFVLLLAVGPNLLQGLAPEWMDGNPSFGGISGVLYGLLGYVWVRSSLNPSLGVSIPLPLVIIFVGMIVVGLADLIPNWQLADLCHLGGLLIGCAYGFASEQR